MIIFVVLLPNEGLLMKVLKNSTHIKIWEQFILTGNLDALSKVYFHYYDFLFDYGMRLTSDRQAVEDAIQSEFINIIKARKNITPVKNLPGYLISSFRRQLIHDLNKQRKLVLSEDMQEERFDYYKSSEQDNSDQERQEQVYSVVKRCIDQLTAKQREIIFLRFEKEISYEEISEMLNISVESCYKSVYRTIKAIKTEAEAILNQGESLILWIILQLNRIGGAGKKQ
ncbi:MAG: sigma-70 family RNA polymerase sigma factor [Mangrovibacterium sp.]